MHENTDEADDTEKRLERALPSLNIDEIWRTVKPLGRFQMVQLVLLYITYFPTAVHIFEYYFIGYEPEHVCNAPFNFTEDYQLAATHIEYEKCSIKYYNDSTKSSSFIGTSCDFGVNYSVPAEKSALVEWDLVCDRRDVGQIPHSLVLAGQGVGAGLTFLADYVGRKNTQIWSQIGIWAASFASSFAPSLASFSFFRLLTGAFQQGIVLSHTILQVELFPLEYRAIFNNITQVAWSASILIFAGIAYVCDGMNWRPLVRIFSLASLGVFAQFFILDESVRWLSVKGRTKEAVRIIKKAFKTNKVPFNNIKQVLDDHDQQQNDKQMNSSSSRKETNGSPYNTESQKHEGFSQFVRDPKLLRNSLIIWFAWFINVLVYYGLYLIPTMSVKDRYGRFALNAASELPGGLILIWLTERYSRKRVGTFLHALAGVILLITTILNNIDGIQDDISILITILAMVGKLSSATCFAFLFVYTPEIFPTNIRQTGIGIASFCGRFGGILAPFSFTLRNYVSWAPATIFGVGCLLVSIAFPILPETNDKPLPQQTIEMKAWDHTSRDQHVVT